MLATPQHIKNQATSFLEKQLKTRLQLTNSQIYEHVIQRYLSCLDVNEVPSQNIFLEYILQENHSMAALSCEFYGGIFYEHLKSRKMIKNLHDFEMGLSTAYHLMSHKHPHFGTIETKTKEILASFRQTTDYLKRKNDLVLHLHN